MSESRDRAEHAWVRARLDAHHLGLLEDSEGERVEKHLGECDDCCAAWLALERATSEQDHHVEAALMVDWKRQQRLLRGLERATVRRHLERCEHCRRDLIAVGHEPVLEFVPALEPEGLLTRPGKATAASSSRPAVVREASPPIAGPEPSPAISRLQWILGGWAGLATAAAAVLLLALLPGGRGPEPGRGEVIPSEPGANIQNAPPRVPRGQSAAQLDLAPEQAGRPAPVLSVSTRSTPDLLVLRLSGASSADPSAPEWDAFLDHVAVGSLPAHDPSGLQARWFVLRNSPTPLDAGPHAFELVAGARRIRYAFRVVSEH